MWTPRRIVLLVLGFALFFSIYLGYGFSYIGRIDGLPPLPAAYFPNPGPTVLPPIKTNQSIVEKLTRSFGPGCEELTRAIRLELHSRSMVLSAGEFKITEGGGVVLTPLSVAMFGKEKGDGRPVELNTIRGNVAYLTFDRPVSNFNEISSRKVVEARLEGNIEVVNNRRRKERDQDLRVQIGTGPLFYSEPRHLIWTGDWVHLMDFKGRPKPHDVKGKGMEMELLTEAQHPPRPGVPARKAKGEAITGVKRIILQANVKMELYIDGKSGFLGGQQAQVRVQNPVTTTDVPGGQAPPPAKPSESARVIICTPGRFTYDIFKDHDMARFEIPEPTPSQRTPEDVTVVREHPDGKTDQLICQQLDLRIRRKEGSTPGILGGQQGAPQRPGQEKSLPPAPGSNKAGQDQGLDIEIAHAIRRFAKSVTLISDPEKLEAIGHDFFYDALKGLTILKAEPTMEAKKDGSIIVARELRIQEIKPATEAGPGVAAKVDPKKPEPKGHQEVTAIGPGELHLPEKGQQRCTTHAYWQDTLVSTKDGPHDLLTLTGDARFLDDKDDQSLKADTIKVWLEPTEKGQDANKSSPANSGPMQGHRPEHLEATGKVVARSREMNIHDTTRLVVWFKNVAAETIPAADSLAPRTGGPQAGVANPTLSATAVARPAGRTQGTPVAQTRTPVPAAQVNSTRSVAAKPAPPPAPQAQPKDGPAALPETAHLGGLAPLPTGPAMPAPSEAAPLPIVEREEKEGPVLGSVEPTARAKGEPSRPLDLTARSVEAWVLRSPVRNQLDKLWTEGDVHVVQAAAKPEEKGTDVRGDTLQMTYHPEGNFLVVTGDLAQLRMDKIYILGPEVNIDQATNKAWVHGVGAMQMESATNLQGDKMDKSVPLTVHWNKSMFFNGESAEFHGGIQAEQEKSRLACQRLQVYFDKSISLRQGTKSGQDAKVRNLVCDREVRMEESTYQGEKLTKYQRIEAPAVQVVAIEQDEPTPRRGEKANAGNMVHASGPGTVRLLQYGGPEPVPTPGAKSTTVAKPPTGEKTAPGKDGKSEEMKVTYVAYQKRMDANSQKKTAYFWENVRVLNMPCTNPNQPIDLDVILAQPLSEGTMYLKCDRLRVLDQPENGKPNQQMEAHGSVYVQGKDYYARADSVFYNQAKDQVIFDGRETGQAALYKIAFPGAVPQVITGKKIIYVRSTGQTEVVGGGAISGESGR